jgi:hypothetical protein
VIGSTIDVAPHSFAPPPPPPPQPVNGILPVRDWRAAPVSTPAPLKHVDTSQVVAPPLPSVTGPRADLLNQLRGGITLKHVDRTKILDQGVVQHVEGAPIPSLPSSKAATSPLGFLLNRMSSVSRKDDAPNEHNEEKLQDDSEWDDPVDSSSSQSSNDMNTLVIQVEAEQLAKTSHSEHNETGVPAVTTTTVVDAPVDPVEAQQQAILAPVSTPISSAIATSKHGPDGLSKKDLDVILKRRGPLMDDDEQDDLDDFVDSDEEGEEASSLTDDVNPFTAAPTDDVDLSAVPSVTPQSGGMFNAARNILSSLFGGGAKESTDSLSASDVAEQLAESRSLSLADSFEDRDEIPGLNNDSVSSLVEELSSTDTTPDTSSHSEPSVAPAPLDVTNLVADMVASAAVQNPPVL